MNIALDVVLVAVLGMGVLGAALATILSQGVSAVLVLVSLTRAETVYRLDWKQVRFHGRLLGDILRVGVPAGLQSNMYAISNILIQTAINGFGTATVAAWTAHGKVDGFFWMILGAYGISITTFAGQNFGAQKYDRIRRSVRVCLALGFGSAVLMSVLYCSLAPYLLGLFTRDAEVVSIGLDMVRQLVPYYFTYVCIEILARRGARMRLLTGADADDLRRRMRAARGLDLYSASAAARAFHRAGELSGQLGVHQRTVHFLLFARRLAARTHP